ncbi:helix-turn-helix domain-containing protein [Mycobacterium sp. NPDC003323]
MPNPPSSASPPTDRVLDIIELLAAADRPLSHTEVVAGAAASRSTTYSILSALTARGWVVRDEVGGSYELNNGVSALLRSPRHTPVLRELAVSTGCQALLSRRIGSVIVTDETAGMPGVAASFTSGFRLPMVAPFGREFVTGLDDSAQAQWFAGLGDAASPIRRRMTAVIEEAARRGYVIERMNDEIVRILKALHVLSDGGSDTLNTRIAAAVTETIEIDFLDSELDDDTRYEVFVISAPVPRSDGGADTCVAVAPFGAVSGAQIRDLGGAVRRAAIAVAGHAPASP